MSLLAETEYTTSATPPVQYEYVWFAGVPVAQVSNSVPSEPLATPEVVWTVTDHLGTPKLQTDPSGTIVWHAEHEPYGQIYVLRTGEGRHQPLRFPGQEAEQLGTNAANGVSERSYNIARWYRAGAGRYTQADPIGVVQGGLIRTDLPHNNLFGYVSGRPLSSIDPLGLKPCKSGECADCPSGFWTIEETSTVAYFTWGFQWEGTATYRCWGNSLKCSVYAKCKALGGGWTIGAGASVGGIGGKNCKCAEDVTDTSSIAGGAGPAQAAWSQGPKCTGFTIGGSTSFWKVIVPSGYLAGVVCETKSLGCSK